MKGPSKKITGKRLDAHPNAGVVISSSISLPTGVERSSKAPVLLMKKTVAHRSRNERNIDPRKEMQGRLKPENLNAKIREVESGPSKASRPSSGRGSVHSTLPKQHTSAELPGNWQMGRTSPEKRKAQYRVSHDRPNWKHAKKGIDLSTPADELIDESGEESFLQPNVRLHGPERRNAASKYQPKSKPTEHQSDFSSLLLLSNKGDQLKPTTGNARKASSRTKAERERTQKAYQRLEEERLEAFLSGVAPRVRRRAAAGAERAARERTARATAAAARAREARRLALARREDFAPPPPPPPSSSSAAGGRGAAPRPPRRGRPGKQTKSAPRKPPVPKFRKKAHASQQGGSLKPRVAAKEQKRASDEEYSDDDGKSDNNDANPTAAEESSSTGSYSDDEDDENDKKTSTPKFEIAEEKQDNAHEDSDDNDEADDVSPLEKLKKKVLSNGKLNITKLKDLCEEWKVDFPARVLLKKERKLDEVLAEVLHRMQKSEQEKEERRKKGQKHMQEQKARAEKKLKTQSEKRKQKSENVKKALQHVEAHCREVLKAASKRPTQSQLGQKKPWVGVMDAQSARSIEDSMPFLAFGSGNPSPQPLQKIEIRGVSSTTEKPPALAICDGPQVASTSGRTDTRLLPADHNKENEASSANMILDSDTFLREDPFESPDNGNGHATTIPAINLEAPESPTQALPIAQHNSTSQNQLVVPSKIALDDAKQLLQSSLPLAIKFNEGQQQGAREASAGESANEKSHGLGLLSKLPLNRASLDILAKSEQAPPFPEAVTSPARRAPGPRPPAPAPAPAPLSPAPSPPGARQEGPAPAPAPAPRVMGEPPGMWELLHQLRAMDDQVLSLQAELDRVQARPAPPAPAAAGAAAAVGAGEGEGRPGRRGPDERRPGGAGLAPGPGRTEPRPRIISLKPVTRAKLVAADPKQPLHDSMTEGDSVPSSWHAEQPDILGVLEAGNRLQGPGPKTRETPQVEVSQHLDDLVSMDDGKTGVLLNENPAQMQQKLTQSAAQKPAELPAQARRAKPKASKRSLFPSGTHQNPNHQPKPSLPRRNNDFFTHTDSDWEDDSDQDDPVSIYTMAAKNICEARNKKRPRNEQALPAKTSATKQAPHIPRPEFVEDVISEKSNLYGSWSKPKADDTEAQKLHYDYMRSKLATVEYDKQEQTKAPNAAYWDNLMQSSAQGKPEVDIDSPKDDANPSDGSQSMQQPKERDFEEHFIIDDEKPAPQHNRGLDEKEQAGTKRYSPAELQDMLLKEINFQMEVEEIEQQASDMQQNMQLWAAHTETMQVLTAWRDEQMMNRQTEDHNMMHQAYEASLQEQRAHLEEARQKMQLQYFSERDSALAWKHQATLTEMAHDHQVDIFNQQLNHHNMQMQQNQILTNMIMQHQEQQQLMQQQQQQQFIQQQIQQMDQRMAQQHQPAAHHLTDEIQSSHSLPSKPDTQAYDGNARADDPTGKTALSQDNDDYTEYLDHDDKAESVAEPVAEEEQSTSVVESVADEESEENYSASFASESQSKHLRTSQGAKKGPQHAGLKLKISSTNQLPAPSEKSESPKATTDRSEDSAVSEVSDESNSESSDASMDESIPGGKLVTHTEATENTTAETTANYSEDFDGDTAYTGFSEGKSSAHIARPQPSSKVTEGKKRSSSRSLTLESPREYGIAMPSPSRSQDESSDSINVFQKHLMKKKDFRNAEYEFREYVYKQKLAEAKRLHEERTKFIAKQRRLLQQGQNTKAQRGESRMPLSPRTIKAFEKDAKLEYQETEARIAAKVARLKEKRIKDQRKAFRMQHHIKLPLEKEPSSLGSSSASAGAPAERRSRHGLDYKGGVRAVREIGLMTSMSEVMGIEAGLESALHDDHHPKAQSGTSSSYYSSSKSNLSASKDRSESYGEQTEELDKQLTQKNDQRKGSELLRKANLLKAKADKLEKLKHKKEMELLEGREDIKLEMERQRLQKEAQKVLAMDTKQILSQEARMAREELAAQQSKAESHEKGNGQGLVVDEMIGKTQAKDDSKSQESTNTYDDDEYGTASFESASGDTITLKRESNRRISTDDNVLENIVEEDGSVGEESLPEAVSEQSEQKSESSAQISSHNSSFHDSLSKNNADPSLSIQESEEHIHTKEDADPSLSIKESREDKSTQEDSDPSASILESEKDMHQSTTSVQDADPSLSIQESRDDKSIQQESDPSTSILESEKDIDQSATSVQEAESVVGPEDSAAENFSITQAIAESAYAEDTFVSEPEQTLPSEVHEADSNSQSEPASITEEESHEKGTLEPPKAVNEKSAELHVSDDGVDDDEEYGESFEEESRIEASVSLQLPAKQTPDQKSLRRKSTLSLFNTSILEAPIQEEPGNDEGQVNSSQDVSLLESQSSEHISTRKEGGESSSNSTISSEASMRRLEESIEGHTSNVNILKKRLEKMRKKKGMILQKQAILNEEEKLLAELQAEEAEILKLRGGVSQKSTMLPVVQESEMEAEMDTQQESYDQAVQHKDQSIQSLPHAAQAPESFEPTVDQAATPTSSAIHHEPFPGKESIQQESTTIKTDLLEGYDLVEAAQPTDVQTWLEDGLRSSEVAEDDLSVLQDSFASESGYDSETHADIILGREQKRKEQEAYAHKTYRAATKIQALVRKRIAYLRVASLRAKHARLQQTEQSKTETPRDEMSDTLIMPAEVEDAQRADLQNLEDSFASSGVAEDQNADILTAESDVIEKEEIEALHKLHEKQKKEQAQRETTAAVKIQAHVRGLSARLRKPVSQKHEELQGETAVIEDLLAEYDLVVPAQQSQSNDTQSQTHVADLLEGYDWTEACARPEQSTSAQLDAAATVIQQEIRLYAKKKRQAASFTRFQALGKALLAKKYCLDTVYVLSTAHANLSAARTIQKALRQTLTQKALRDAKAAQDRAATVVQSLFRSQQAVQKYRQCLNGIVHLQFLCRKFIRTVQGSVAPSAFDCMNFDIVEACVSPHSVSEHQLEIRQNRELALLDALSGFDYQEAASLPDSMSSDHDLQDSHLHAKNILGWFLCGQIVRRRFSNQRAAAIHLQSFARAKIQKQRFSKEKKAATTIQSFARVALMINTIQQQKTAVAKIQSVYKKHMLAKALVVKEAMDEMSQLDLSKRFDLVEEALPPDSEVIDASHSSPEDAIMVDDAAAEPIISPSIDLLGQCDYTEPARSPEECTPSLIAPQQSSNLQADKSTRVEPPAKDHSKTDDKIQDESTKKNYSDTQMELAATQLAGPLIDDAIMLSLAEYRKSQKQIHSNPAPSKDEEKKVQDSSSSFTEHPIKDKEEDESDIYSFDEPPPQHRAPEEERDIQEQRTSVLPEPCQDEDQINRFEYNDTIIQEMMKSLAVEDPRQLLEEGQLEELLGVDAFIAYEEQKAAKESQPASINSEIQDAQQIYRRALFDAMHDSLLDIVTNTRKPPTWSQRVSNISLRTGNSKQTKLAASSLMEDAVQCNLRKALQSAIDEPVPSAEGTAVKDLAEDSNKNVRRSKKSSQLILLDFESDEEKLKWILREKEEYQINSIATESLLDSMLSEIVYELQGVLVESKSSSTSTNRTHETETGSNFNE